MWNYLLFDGVKRQLHCLRADETKMVITPSVEAWLDRLCKEGGSSLKERKLLAMAILNRRNKVPILTALEPFTLYFPWKYTDPDYSCWINRARVCSVKDHFSRGIITFRDGQQLEVPDARRLCSHLSDMDVLLQVLQPSSLFPDFLS